MEKKAHQYKLTLTYLKNVKGESMDVAPVELAVENHDDIFAIIERLQAKDLFNNKDQTAEFAIGLKLFTEVMLKHKNHPLFADLLPAIASFMKKLKTMP
ncbi:DUF3861 domain-containing protein [Olivibacter sp. XZL3]|uniref:DUF3861 domain-containing protein n=1 Tax=Olivibacter sp. XZL3 TaxID=1735116 RepID=UPI001065F40A|nr:DUF3861 domain-containing protein [Olivibacter sp. XZL3]